MLRDCSLIVGLIAATAVVALSAEPAEVKPLPQANIGLPRVLFRDVHPGLVDIAAKPFKETIQKTAGLSGNLVIAQDYKAITNQLRAKTLDIALYHGFEYAWVRANNPDLDLVPLVVTVPSCGKVQACLVVHSSCEAKTPKDLKGECIAIHKGLKAHCQMYLDQLRQDMPEGRCCPMKSTGATPEEVLDEVVAQTSAAALVDISSLLTYKDNNPGQGTWLKILASSDPLPAAVVVCRNGALTNQQAQAIKEGLVNCKNTVQGKIFLRFWNLKAFDVPNQDYFDLVDKCRIAHPEPKASPK